MIRNSGFGVFLWLCLAAMPSHAQDVSHLTDDNVREFIQKTANIAKGIESEMSEEDISAFLTAHIHDDARFKSTMRYAVPGFDVQQTTMSVDKDDFIENIHNASNTNVSNYENIIEIDEIKISKDGKKAIVKTRSLESAVMPVTDNIEQEEVPVEGVSSCTQIIMLSKKNVIQMFNATCLTDIQFQTFDP